MPKHHGKIPSSCYSKKRGYVDRQKAVKAGRLAEKVIGAPLRVYRCSSCGQYHLTKQKEFRP